MDSQGERLNEGIQNEQTAKKEFALKLGRSPQDVVYRYSGILLGEQLKLAQKNKGRPVDIPVEERERFLRLAASGYDRDSVEKMEKMEKDWNSATSKDGRPPIGGAQHD